MSAPASPPTALVASVPGARRASTFSLADLKERSNQKLVVLVFGDKDSGKTYELLSLPGRKLVLSFDNQAKGVKDGAFAGDKNIWVVDVLQYYRDTQPEEADWSGKVAADFVEYAIQTISPLFHPHWIIFDGGAKVEEIAEMKMRWLYHLVPGQGTKNRNVWKIRRMVLRSFHRNALALAQMGVGYSVYYAGGDIDDADPKKKPRWIDVILEESEIEIERRNTYSTSLRADVYSAYVYGAKPHLRDFAVKGTVVDISIGKSFPWGPGLAARFARAEKALEGIPIEYPSESPDGAGTLRPLPAREDPPPQFTAGEEGPTIAPLQPSGVATAKPASLAPVAPPDFSKMAANEV